MMMRGSRIQLWLSFLWDKPRTVSWETHLPILPWWLTCRPERFSSIKATSKSLGKNPPNQCTLTLNGWLSQKAMEHPKTWREVFKSTTRSKKECLLESGRTLSTVKLLYVTFRILTISVRTSISPISKMDTWIGCMNLSRSLIGWGIMLLRIRERTWPDYSIRGCTALLHKIYWPESFILLCLIRSQLMPGPIIRTRCLTHTSIDQLRSLFLLWCPTTVSSVLKLRSTPIVLSSSRPSAATVSLERT